MQKLTFIHHGAKNMVKIYQAKSKEDFEFARELFFEFLTWAIEKSKKNLWWRYRYQCNGKSPHVWNWYSRIFLSWKAAIDIDGIYFASLLFSENCFNIKIMKELTIKHIYKLIRFYSWAKRQILVSQLTEIVSFSPRPIKYQQV